MNWKEIRNAILDKTFEKKIKVTVFLTTENEILIYTERDKDFRNILIDEDGDVEILFVPNIRSNTTTEYIPNKDVDIDYLISKL